MTKQTDRFKLLNRDVVRQMTAHLPRRQQSEYTRAVFSSAAQAIRVGLDLKPQRQA